MSNENKPDLELKPAADGHYHHHLYLHRGQGHCGGRGFFFKKIVGVLAVIGIGAGLGAMLTGCHHKTPEEKAAWVVKKITSELDLTDAQKPKLQAVADFIVAERKAHEAQREETITFALAQVRGDRLDRVEAERRIVQKLDDLKQKAPRLLELVAEFHASLTREQRENAASKLEKLKNCHR